MKKTITIVMYHYVRELPHTRYPKIKGLLTSLFKEQLAYLEKYYQFVTVEECINACYSGASFPSNAILLTFDDGYIDHYTNVFPLLEEKGIQGAFFPPAKAILENRVLDVNKIQFILAQNITTRDLLNYVLKCLDKHRNKYSLRSNDYYFSKFAKANQWDSKEIVFIKCLLQVGLEEKLRNLIIDELFQKHVSDDEEVFSKELYMNIDQMRCMVRSGMYIGSHGYSHYWMNKIPPSVQEQEISFSLNLLEEIGSPTNNWVMCYPYGAYDSSLIEILKEKNCKLALTDISVNQGIAVLDKDSAFSLGRLDTNDLPKAANAEISDWTRRIVPD
jgi:peptidoglycan/xylan/chitin deacetylase (PgdA/CDA1 family)